MEPEFWHQRWASNQIGFHEGQVNAYLARHYAHLAVLPGQAVFVQLSSKSVDLRWLAEREKAAGTFSEPHAPGRIGTVAVTSILLKPRPRDQGGETA